ncbi:MAG: LacI family DNA-binding transcriptional regulator [Aristaeellaceae bacterium]
MRSSNMHRKVTLKDIAQATGYSVNTVSRALRGKDDIAPETRQKIRQVQQEMGYINNSLASSLRRGYTNTIAVILGDISNPHFGIMMSEIEAHARAYGYSAFLQSTNEDDALERKAIESALNRSVDGIILCPCQSSEDNVRYLQSLGIPFVLIGRRFESLATDYVVCDDETGGYLATRKLLQCGHRRILTLQGAEHISSVRERLRGYRRAHAEMNVPVDERLIWEGSVIGENNDERYERMFAQVSDFTAVFAFSDLIAWDFWRFLRRKGLRVPEDVSLVGFDHIQSRLPNPFDLTSIRSYKKTMSTQAVDVLIHKLQEDSRELTQIVIETSLHEGETVRRPV